MSKAGLKGLLVRNFGFWIAAALVYPIAHWIPTASGQPPRIFDVLVPVFVLALGFASNVFLGSAIRTAAGIEPQTADGSMSPKD